MDFNLFSKTRKETGFDYFRERDLLLADLEVLDAKAGIRDRMERCARLVEPDYFRDRGLLPFGTRARVQARREQEVADDVVYRDCIRRVIFSVEDTELRRELIKIERKFHMLKLRSFESDLHN
jgi:hypothetical protein